ncbi:MAG TPA: hypothetical protein VGQ85_10335, partial [Candidatus Limnocylindrales bacterium]|nr:hypothetical protein [Candidatus Limnocylindrales bacterium]
TPVGSATTGGSKAIVDLTLSGAASVTAKGSAGHCELGKDASGNVAAFGFSATESDYPGLASGLFISEAAGGSVTIKWLQSASVGYLNTGQGAVVSADHKSVTLNSDLGGAVPLHLAGSVICP